MRIETPRLILRTWGDQDLGPFAALNADPRVMKYFPKTLTLEETHEFINTLKEKFDKDGFSFMAVELKSTHEFIGMIGLNVPGYTTPFTPCVEIGWRLAFDHWNKGYATEGALACLEYGFQQLDLDKIVSFTAFQNTPSRRIMEKIGMTYVQKGDFNHPRLPQNHSLSRHVLYEIHSPPHTRIKSL